MIFTILINSSLDQEPFFSVKQKLWNVGGANRFAQQWVKDFVLHLLFRAVFGVLSGVRLSTGRLRRAVRGSGLKSLSPWCPMKSCRIINLVRAEFLFCPVRSAPFPSLHWWISHIWVFLFLLHWLINSPKHELTCVCEGLAGSDSCWRTSCVAFGCYGVPAWLFPDFGVYCKQFYLLR